MFDYLENNDKRISSNPILTLQSSTGTTLTYTKNEVIVGRSPAEYDVVVDNRYASKIHMRFIFFDGKWIAEDLNSANGTWINGEKISSMQSVILKAGDRIVIARYSVFYFQEKLVEDTDDDNVEIEKNVNELEAIIYSIRKQGENVLTSQSIGHLIDLLCETPLFIRAIIGNSKNQEEGLQVVLFKPASEEIIPVFTRQQHADSFGKGGDVIKLEPENLMFTLYQLGEHIVINPNCENRLIIPKDIFKEVIFREFAKKLKAKVSVKKYEEKNDVFAALICDYNMETNQSEKMRKIMTIFSYMEENVAWVPCSVSYSEDDYEKIKNVKDEAPIDYANNFSWINLPIVQYCELAKNNPVCSGIIVNAFTNTLLITNDLIDIVLNHHFAKINLINDEQMLRAVKEANGDYNLNNNVTKGIL